MFGSTSSWLQPGEPSRLALQIRLAPEQLAIQVHDESGVRAVAGLAGQVGNAADTDGGSTHSADASSAAATATAADASSAPA